MREWTRWERGLALLVSATAFASCEPAARPAISAAEFNQGAAPPDETPVVSPAAVAPSRPPAVMEATASVEPVETVEKAAPHETLSEVPPLVRSLPHLEPFYAALDALRRKERTTPVRILWLGDSHTAADFLTHPIRKRLEESVPMGGPGFVRLGMSAYRHGAVKFQVTGKFRKAPLLPAQQTRVLDGVFGYGGIRTLPASGAMVSASLREPRDAPVTWTLSYRLAPGDKLEASLGDRVVLLTFDENLGPAQAIQTATFSGSGTDTFSLAHVGGDPEVFGAFVEYDSPGVVLDTVGINGARMATALAWEPLQYQKELEQRRPDLLVLAFGTNEIFDKASVDRYREQFRSYVEIVRAVQPELPCWIVGPPDAATNDGKSRTRVEEVTEVQREAAADLGCAFSSQYELMGGEGSFGRWMSERPSKARADHIHFTIAGYEALGEALGEQLVIVPPDGEVPSDGPGPAGHPAEVVAGVETKNHSGTQKGEGGAPEPAAVPSVFVR